MSNFQPADVYRLTGTIYTRTDNVGGFVQEGFESKLLELFKQTKDLSRIAEQSAAHIQEWPMRYQLAAQRPNLLRPFAGHFAHKLILEIGSEGGALTRFMGECGGRVVALEGNYKLAEATAERCRDLHNVVVINDEFERFESDTLFDVIVSLDIKNLNKAAALLKDDGILIVAADNRLGLQHWAGVPQYNNNRKYAGIEQRNNESIGKEELHRLLLQAGFAHNEYYFPFPDYRLPSVIIKESAWWVSGLNIADLLLSNLQYVRDYWYAPGFSLELAVRQVIENGLMADLSNSLLVVAQKEPQVIIDDELLAWSYSAQRRKAYQKENIFKLTADRGVFVVKRRMYPQEVQDAALPLKQHIHNEQYILGNMYYLGFINIITKPGWALKDLVDWAFPYYKQLMSLAHQRNNEWYLDGQFVDCTPFNILADKQGQLHVFDQEWQVNEPVPLSFVLFRGMYYTLARPLAYYPPKAGTPVFAFELIKEIVKPFYRAAETIAEDFVEQEFKWFGPISFFSDQRSPNFRLHVLPEKDYADPAIKTDLTITPLHTIRTTVAGEQRIIELKPEPVVHSFKVNKQTGPFKVQLADQTGVIGLAMSGEVELHDVILVDELAVLLSDNAFIVFHSPNEEIDLTLWAVPTTEALANTMNKLMPLLRSTTQGDVQQLVNALVNATVQPVEQELDAANKTIELLEEQVADQEKQLAHLNDTAGLYNEALAENARLRQTIDWYTRTYEKRSLAGVLKERIKNSYRALIDRLLGTSYIRNKFAAAYVLQYARDNGPKQFIAASFRTVAKHGFNSKQVVRSKLQRKPIAVLPVKVENEPIDKKEMLQWQMQPLISIIIPVYNTKPSLLEAAIKSVQDQVYENWELCIVDDASTSAATKRVLAKYRNDPKIKIDQLSTNGGISRASNKALDLATGDFVALFDHDDELTKDALFWVVKEINADKDVDIIYSDECKVDEQGQLSDHFRKPDWSPELLLNMMYSGHLTVYRKDFLENKVGRFRKEYDFSQDYDLMLRASEQTTKIRHIPRILYHWRITEGSASQGDKPYARQTNLGALADAMQRRGLDAGIIELPTANRVKLKAHVGTRVSLIIPTDSQNNLEAAIESITNNTSYSNYEIVVVTNSGLIHTMRQNHYTFSRINYVPYDLPYNFSDKCNVGADHATGDVVIFFNDDVRPMQHDWIEHTIEYLWLPGVGGVSPKLLYENDTIQYAGMATGVRNLTGTTFHCYAANAVNYFNFPQSVRNVSILSGACMAMPRSLFLNLGGFDHINTPSAHSDVDLSFKILEAGYRCVYTPYATLRHIGHLSLAAHEKKEKPDRKDKADLYLLRRWAKFLGDDPYFTPPMRDLLYHDSPEPFRLFTPVKSRKYGNKGDLLLVSHDLTLSGAPIMLYDTAKLLLKNGYFVTVCCTSDGPLRKLYQESGVPVMIDPLIVQEHPSFYRFAKNFDTIICNTVVTWPIVKQMQHKVKTIWWLQEAQVLQPYLNNPEFVKTLRQAKHLVSVSDYAISYIKDYNPRFNKIHNACEDFVGSAINTKPKSTLIFSIVGSIEYRKGQDVVLEAMSYLEKEVLEQLELHIVGRTLDQAFKERLPANDRVRYIGELSHEDSVSYLYGSDVVISASRDDPFPVVLVEALCMGKPCIVSDKTGTAELIKEGKNGFVFASEDARSLAKKITQIVRTSGLVQRIGAEARKTYEQYLTLETFEKRLLGYLQDPALSNKTKTEKVTTLSEE